MLTAEGDTFEERSPKWRHFYAQQGWAQPVPDEPAAAPRRRGRQSKARAEPEPEPEPVAQEVNQKADEYDIETLTNEQLRELAEQQGHELPAGYIKNDDLIAMIRGAE